MELSRKRSSDFECQVTADKCINTTIDCMDVDNTVNLQHRQMHRYFFCEVDSQIYDKPNCHNCKEVILKCVVSESSRMCYEDTYPGVLHVDEENKSIVGVKKIRLSALNAFGEIDRELEVSQDHISNVVASPLNEHINILRSSIAAGSSSPFSDDAIDGSGHVTGVCVENPIGLVVLNGGY